MIPARVRPWFARWMVGRVEARIRHTFGRVRIAGLDRLREATRAGPVLLVANHSAWWDAMLVAWLSRRELQLDAYALMDAENLKRAPFFASLGGFGVDRQSRRDGARAIRYAAERLAGAGSAVWVFAQGEERPWHERPLRFHPGAARIARLAPHALVLPVGFAYVFGGVEKPDAWVSIGEPVSHRDLDALAHRVEGELTGLLRGIAGDDAAVRDVLVSAAPWLPRVAERALAWWSGRRIRGEAAIGAHPQPALPPADVTGAERS